jgi:hypothetical protein
MARIDIATWLERADDELVYEDLNAEYLDAFPPDSLIPEELDMGSAIPPAIRPPRGPVGGNCSGPKACGLPEERSGS